MLRMVRGALIEAVESDYVEMATLKGLPRWRVILVHALPNSLPPIVQVVLLAIIGPFIAPHSPTRSVVQTFGTPGSGNGLLGGDLLGRDVLSRVLAGGWLLLVVAAGATLLGVVLGVMLGVTAAYVGSWKDGLIMRVVDVLLAFPQLVFALLLVSVAGTHIWLLILAVGLSHAPQVARVVRAAALDVCERDFVKAVELYDTPALRVMTGE